MSGEIVIDIDQHCKSVNSLIDKLSANGIKGEISLKDITAKIKEKYMPQLVHEMLGLIADSQIIVRFLKTKMIQDNAVTKKLTSLEIAVKQSNTKMDSLANAVNTTNSEFSSYSACVKSGLDRQQKIISIK